VFAGILAISCRAQPCPNGYQQKIDRHHLVKKSQGGDDVAENLFAICSSCHRTFENAGGDKARDVAERIRRNLTEAERQYIVGKKNLGWLMKKYPLPPRPGVLSAAGVSSGASEVGTEPVGETPASTPAAESIQPVWIRKELPPGQDCPTCGRRVKHPKKTTSPVSHVFSHRGPLDSKDEYKEILTAALKHGGMAGEEKYFEHEGILRMSAQVLAGPPGTLVKAP